MSTVDFRTRQQGDEETVDPSTFLGDRAPGVFTAPGSEDRGWSSYRSLAPLTFDVDGHFVTLVPHDNGIAIESGKGDGLVVTLDPTTFSDLMLDRISTFGAEMLGRAALRRGPVDSFVAWEPALRSLLDGRPAYTSGSVTFRDRDGSTLDIRRSFTLDDDPEEIGHFLAEAGYLHVAGVFSETEMAAVSRDLDDAMASAEQNDGASWWARTKDDEWYPARILGFNQKSPTLRELLDDERFTTLGTFTDDSYVQRDPHVGDSAEGLMKRIGVIEGISDVSWHKDCSMGGHSRSCCGLTVGISVTGAGPENGELGVVAGSHRANIAPLGVEGVDLPRLPLPTRVGDITIHCSCTLHMSRQPVSAERRVVYTGFFLAPRPGDDPVQGDPAQLRRERAALGETVRSGQRESEPGSRRASFDL